MRDASTYRAARRNAAQTTGQPVAPYATKLGTGKLDKWLGRHPKLAPFYSMAVRMLGHGAKWHAVRKMTVVLAQSPKVKPIGYDTPLPYPAILGRHERGSWRSFPRVVIDANLRVAK